MIGLSALVGAAAGTVSVAVGLLADVNLLTDSLFTFLVGFLFGSIFTLILGATTS